MELEEETTYQTVTEGQESTGLASGQMTQLSPSLFERTSKHQSLASSSAKKRSISDLAMAFTEVGVAERKAKQEETSNTPRAQGPMEPLQAGRDSPRVRSVGQSSVLESRPEGSKRGHESTLEEDLSYYEEEEPDSL